MTLSQKHVQPSGTRQLTLDDQIFRLQPFGGISTYWHELKAGLTANQASYELVRAQPLVRIQPARAPGSVFHSSYYRFATGRDSRTVTTVHDLIPERGLSPSAASRVFTAYRRALFRVSDGFICVSEQTKNDLLAMYPKECMRKPIHVAQHGNPRSSFIPRGEPLPEPASAEMRQRAFIFVGNRDGYKSFDVAVDAFALSRLWSDGCLLLCTGAAFSPQEHKMLERRGIASFVRSTGPLATQDLFELYATSLGLLYPSSYEGFGFPIVEAMSFGCIPMVADLEPMRSIVQGVVKPFPAGNAYALRDLMVDLADPHCAAKLATRALERANDFQWGQSIDLHIALYRLLGADLLHDRWLPLGQVKAE
jgi:glycosyltransferase involved in cell wall biosynthesis